MRIRFDLHQLNIFCTVAEMKSFSAAAKKLFLTQPTVSDHIKKLEESVGTLLIERQERNIRLTRAGVMLFEYAQKILGLSREAEGALDELLKHYRGEIRVGATPYLGEYVLPGKIADFQRRNPEVKISLEIAKGGQIRDRIEAGRLDLGAVGKKISHPRLTTVPFLKDRIFLVAPAGHPLTGSDRVTLRLLSQVRVILREEGSETRKAVEKLLHRVKKSADLKEVLRNTIELGSCSAAKEGVKKGLGIAFLPEHSIKDELESKTLKVLNLSGTPLERDYYLIYLSTWGEGPLGKNFVLSLRSQNPGTQLEVLEPR